MPVKTILNRSYILEQMVENGEIAIIGAMHHLDSGMVEFMDDTWVSSKKEIESNVSFSNNSAKVEKPAKAVAASQ